MCCSLLLARLVIVGGTDWLGQGDGKPNLKLLPELLSFGHFMTHGLAWPDVLIIQTHTGHRTDRARVEGEGGWSPHKNQFDSRHLADDSPSLCVGWLQFPWNYANITNQLLRNPLIPVLRNISSFGNIYFVKYFQV